MPAEHAVILDAGSSGTRLFIYRWERWHEGDPAPPSITQVYSCKNSECGISDLAKKGNVPTLGSVGKYLRQLFENARIFLGPEIPPRSVPLFLLATAGVRDLHDDMVTVLLDKLVKYTKKCGFLWKECGTITGEEEALYGWVAANYSLGHFSGYGLEVDRTVGYLEMGGASAQIAFRPTPQERAAYKGGYIRIMIGGKKFYMYLQTLPLGANKAWDLHQRAVRLQPGKDEGGKQVVYDPCIPSGWESKEENGKIVKGSGDYVRCLNLAYYLLKHVWKHSKGSTKPTACPPPTVYPLEDEPEDGNPFSSEEISLFNDEAQIEFNEDRQFVGGANFWYTTREIFGLDSEGQPKKEPYSLKKFLAEAFITSFGDWNDLKKRTPGVQEEYLLKAWFMAAWVTCVLHGGFGFPYKPEKAEDGDISEKDLSEGDLSDGDLSGEDEDAPGGGGSSGGAALKADKLSFRPYNGPDGAELNWTLGRIVLFATGDDETKEMKTVELEAEEKKEMIEGRKRTREQAKAAKAAAKKLAEAESRAEKIAAEERKKIEENQKKKYAEVEAKEREKIAKIFAEERRKR